MATAKAAKSVQNAADQATQTFQAMTAVGQEKMSMRTSSAR